MSEEPRRTNRTWIVVVVVLAVLAIVLCACLAVVVGANMVRNAGTPQVNVEPAERVPWLQRWLRSPWSNLPGIGGGIEARRTMGQTFAAQPGVAVDVDNSVGSVEITGTDKDQVVIDVVVHAYATTSAEAERLADEITVELSQQSDGSVSVATHIPEQSYAGRSPSVDLSIQVPRRCRLTVNQQVGGVNIEDVEAALDARVDVGDLDVRRLTLAGDAQLDVGVGSISVSLPSDATFDLDARTDVGAVDCAFDVQPAQQRRSGVGDVLQGTVGADPTYTLKLTVSTGGITIKKG